MHQSPKIHKANTDRIQGRNSSTVLVFDCSTPLKIMGRISRQKIYKERGSLNNTINQLYPTDTYSTLYPTKQHTFL